MHDDVYVRWSRTSKSIRILREIAPMIHVMEVIRKARMVSVSKNKCIIKLLRFLGIVTRKIRKVYVVLQRPFFDIIFEQIIRRVAATERS